MRLSLYCEKLEYEVNEASSYLTVNGSPDQRIQVHIYCIAALVRKILERVEGADQKYRVQVSELGHDMKQGKRTHVGLDWFSSRILHYMEFLPTWPAPVAGHETFITVLSDYDEHLSRRRVGLREFIGIARRIAERDEQLVTGVLDHTIGKLQWLMSLPAGTPTTNLDTTLMTELLIDAFDLVRMVKEEDSVSGKLPLFHYDYVMPQEGNILNMVVERKTAELDYSVLFRSLFAGWRLHPIRAFDFQPYPNHDYGPDLHGKRILDIESFDNGAHSTFYIQLEDVVTGLTAVEQKLRHK